MVNFGEIGKFKLLECVFIDFKNVFFTSGSDNEEKKIINITLESANKFDEDEINSLLELIMNNEFICFEVDNIKKNVYIIKSIENLSQIESFKTVSIRFVFSYERKYNFN